MSEKRFPILETSPREYIPWEIAETAYVEYSRRYGTEQSLERIAERGGFAYSELDMLYPDWRIKMGVA